jgi:hypothetical protein
MLLSEIAGICQTRRNFHTSSLIPKQRECYKRELLGQNNSFLNLQPEFTLPVGKKRKSPINTFIGLVENLSIFLISFSKNLGKNLNLNRKFTVPFFFFLLLCTYSSRAHAMAEDH